MTKAADVTADVMVLANGVTLTPDDDGTYRFVIRENTVLVLTSTPVSEAVWYIQYDANGGTGGIDAKTMYMKSTGVLSWGNELKRDGYKLTGWSTSKDGEKTYELGASITAAAAGVQENGTLKLYAVWSSNTVDVTFDANGGKLGAESAQTVSYTKGEKLGTLPEPSRDGYRFVGWFTAETDGDKVYGYTAANADAVYYAHWEDDRVQLTVAKNETLANIEGIESGRVPAGTTVTFTVTPETGKYVKVMANSTELTAQDGKYTYTVLADTTIYLTEVDVQGQPVGETWTIRYETDGTGRIDDQKVAKTGVIALDTGAALAKNNYTLTGWSVSKDGAADYGLNQVVNGADLTGDLTLYPVWTRDSELPAAQKVTVTLDANGGELNGATSSFEREKNGTYGYLPTPTYADHTFAGWFCGETQVDANSRLALDRDHTLTAKWQENRCTLVIDGDEALGTVTVAPAAAEDGTYLSGTALTVTVTPAQGTALAALRIQANGAYIALDQNGQGSFIIKENTRLTLSAVPDTLKTWYVRYDANGGSGDCGPFLMTAEGTNVLLGADGFANGVNTLTGWNTKADGTGTDYRLGQNVNGLPDGIDVGETLTLYAVWQQESAVTVTFDPQGGTLADQQTRTYKAGDVYGALPEPTREGDWQFGGWYSDNRFANRVLATDQVPAGDHTLYAKWVSFTEMVVTAAGYTGEYDGVAHALTAETNLPLKNATYQWFKDGKAIAGATSREFFVKNAADTGSYTCRVSGSYQNVQYTDLESTTAVVSIARRQLTVTAANAAVLYGSESPAYALSYSGFAAADDASVLKGAAKAVCTYVKGSDAGEYDITVDVSGLTADNYRAAAADGKLTVKPLPASIEWDKTKLEFNGQTQYITAAVKNAVGSDTFALVCTGNAGKNEGEYSAEVTALGNDNYTLVGASGVKHNWVIYAQGTNPGEVPDPEQPDEPEKTVTGITLDPASKTVKVNEAFTLTYTLQPDGVQDTVVFTSSDNSIASVDDTGKVTAKASGTAVITVTTSGGLTAACTVTVSAQAPEGPTPVTGITIQYTSYKLTRAGQDFNVGARVQPSNATNQKISYSSSNNAVAAVDADGKVTAISSGTAVIYAQTDDGGYTLICTVTVEISSSGSGSGGSSGGGSTGGGGSSGGGGGSTGGGTTGGSTNGGSISAGGTGSTAYVKCKRDKTCPIASFVDAYPNDWYHDGVHYCIDNGLMGGYGENKLGPNDKISRAQIVMALWRIAGSPTADNAVRFADVPESAWYAQAVGWAAGAGVASGYGDGRFGADDAITREQFAVMLYRFAQLQGKDVSRGSTNTLTGFTDAGSISGYALTAMQWANGMGIISGTDNSTLMPQGNATRAQAACMIQRYIINLAE